MNIVGFLEGVKKVMIENEVNIISGDEDGEIVINGGDYDEIITWFHNVLSLDNIDNLIKKFNNNGGEQ